MWTYCFYTDLFISSSLIDFLFVEGHSSCFSGTRSLQESLESLSAKASSLSSITSLKHGLQYATELPISQPLIVSSFWKTIGHTEEFRAPQTSILYFLDTNNKIVLLSLPFLVQSALLGWFGV